MAGSGKAGNFTNEGLIEIDTFSIKRAVCPFCRQQISITEKIIKHINITHDKSSLKSILSCHANRVKCNECGEEFYYEHNCSVINSDKNYAIASLPMMLNPLPDEKTSLFRILKKRDFRLRYVHEFICLSEKVRIFEFGLDDRVLEIIKYNYVASPKGLGADAKIILTGVDGNALIFTVYDDYDRPLATHRVSIDAYASTRAQFDKELIDGPTLTWRKIDLNWAEQYTKENKK